jgi:hypothetical protein
MKIYMFEADLYCGPCGEAIAATLPAPDAWEREHPDSASHPVAYDSNEGQCDSPDHCGQCQLFLERNLTEEGVRYVKEIVAEDLSTEIEIVGVVREWIDFYGIDAKDCVDDDVTYWREINELPPLIYKKVGA